MARGDKSGPMGQGSMTGRKLGFCAGYDSPGFDKGFGSGMGSGRGFSGRTGRGLGRGFRRMLGFGSSFYDFNRNDEITNLKAQANSLKQAQEKIEKRLKDLEAE